MPRMRESETRSTTTRALALLDAVAAHPGSTLSLSELADAAGLPLATAHRYARELVAWGGLERTPEGRYRLGLRVWQLGTRTRWDRALRQASAPILDRLALATGIAACAMSYTDGEVVTVERRWGKDRSTWISPIGRALPVFVSTAGRLLAAHAGDAERARLSAALPASAADAFDRDLARTRARGYAVELDLVRAGQGAVSVAVPGPHARDVALTYVFPDDEVRVAERHLDDLRLAAAALSVALARAEPPAPSP